MLHAQFSGIDDCLLNTSFSHLPVTFFSSYFCSGLGTVCQSVMPFIFTHRSLFGPRTSQWPSMCQSTSFLEIMLPNMLITFSPIAFSSRNIAVSRFAAVIFASRSLVTTRYVIIMFTSQQNVTVNRVPVTFLSSLTCHVSYPYVSQSLSRL